MQPGVDTDRFFPERIHQPRDRRRALIEGHTRSYKALPESYAAIPASWEIWGLAAQGQELLSELERDARLQRALVENGLAVAETYTWRRMVTKLDRVLRSES